jgi:DNA-binding MarR family transcriptional regulator
MQLWGTWEEASLPLLLTLVRSRLRQVSWHLLAPFDITPQQYQVLMTLVDHPGLSHRELAEALVLDKPTATRILQALQRKAWIRILPHPHHGRKLRIELTPEGTALTGRLQAFRHTIRKGLERDLDPEERRTLRLLLRRLKENLDLMDSSLDAPSEPSDP